MFARKMGMGFGLALNWRGLLLGSPGFGFESGGVSLKNGMGVLGCRSSIRIWGGGDWKINE